MVKQCNMCKNKQLGDAVINDYKLCSYKFCFCSRSFFQYSCIQWFRNEIWINFFSIKICIDSWIIKVAMLKSYFLFKVKSLLLNLIWNIDDNKRFINDHRIIASENSEIPHLKFHMAWNIKNLSYQKWTLSKMNHTKKGPLRIWNGKPFQIWPPPRPLFPSFHFQYKVNTTERGAAEVIFERVT